MNLFHVTSTRKHNSQHHSSRDLIASRLLGILRLGLRQELRAVLNVAALQYAIVCPDSIPRSGASSTTARLFVTISHIAVVSWPEARTIAFTDTQTVV